MTIAPARPTESTSGRAIAVSRRDPRARLAGYLLLALASFGPPLWTHPGKVAADTKQYLYLDPGRLLSRAASMWDPNIGFGTVTHQTIGYLFPMGPYYWTMDRLGVPDWVAQRLWLGALIFTAGLGVLYLMRRLGRVGPGVVVTALAYMFSPYLLDYSARISVLLMPWTALGFLIGFVVDASRSTDRLHLWTRAALFAITVQIIGGVNATALLFALIAPGLWLLYVVATRELSLRRFAGIVARIGVLTGVTSLWWAAGLSLQGAYGLDILKFTETVKAVARTSVPNEVLRGLGYWFFYGSDRIGPWTEAAATYTQNVAVILAGYTLAGLALLSMATLRWSRRAYFALLALVGTVIAVGANPYRSPSPLGALFKAWANSSKAGLALRSTGRATPLVVLGLAALLGAAVDATVRWLRRQSWRRAPLLALAVPAVVGALIVGNLPALWNGTYYGKNLERPENIPAYWYDAARAIDARGSATRALELPGADFASYRWGNLVDPVTPGITDRPYVARELVPWGGDAAQNLLDAFDRRFQENVADQRGIADLLRLMSAGSLVLRYDIQHERYNVVRPKELARDLQGASGLVGPEQFGGVLVDNTRIPETDERTLGAPANQPEPPPVALYDVPGARPIVRAESSDAPLVVAGDGEGLVDASDVGLLAGSRTVLYSGSYDAATLRSLGADGILVVTDSNRKRAQRWSTVLDNYGQTEERDQLKLGEDPGDARLVPFPNAGPDAYTVADDQGVAHVAATAYGNPISYTPEDRPERAFDGDYRTAWKTQAFDDALGQKLRVVTSHPITTDHVRLVQVIEGPRDRYITQVRLRLDGHDVGTFALDESSRVRGGQVVHFPRRTFSSFEVEITNTNRGKDELVFGGESAVGFTEVDLRDARDVPVRVHEVIDLPTDLLDAFGASSLQHPLVIIMARDRQLPVPPRYDPELVMSRGIVLPTARTFSVTGTARLTSDVQSQQLDAVFGIPDAAHGGVTARAKEYLAGCIRCRAPEAIDDDPTTAWTTPFVGPVDQWVEYTLPAPLTVSEMNLQIVADGRHSRPTKLRISAGGRSVDVAVPVVANQRAENATQTVHLTFPAVRGNVIRIQILDVTNDRTTNYFRGDPFLRPVGIAEWGIPGLHEPSAPATLPAPCRTDLLTIDGRPVPIRITGTRHDAEWLQPLSIVPCDPNDPSATPALTLAPGPHQIETAPGRLTGINLDRLVLASDAGGGPHAVADGRVDPFAPPTGAPTVTVTHNGRTAITLRVQGATRPFWLVLGESQNKGWQASVAGGRSLGGSTLVDGYANGWFVRPARADFVVHLEWTPQRRVWFGLAASVAGALVCLVLLALGWRRRRHGWPVPGPVEHPAFVAVGWRTQRSSDPAPLSPRSALLVSLALGLVAAIVVAPTIGVAVAAFAFLVARVGRARLPAALVGPALFAAGMLYIAGKQWRNHFPPLFEWPTLFPRAVRPTWFAIFAVASVVVVDLVRAHGRDAPGDHDDEHDAIAGEVPAT